MSLLFCFLLSWGLIVVRVPGVIQVPLDSNNTLLENLLFINIFHFFISNVVVNFTFCLLMSRIEDFLCFFLCIAISFQCIVGNGLWFLDWRLDILLCDLLLNYWKNITSKIFWQTLENLIMVFWNNANTFRESSSGTYLQSSSTFLHCKLIATRITWLV